MFLCCYWSTIIGRIGDGEADGKLRRYVALMLLVVGFCLMISTSFQAFSTGEEKISATVAFKPETLNLKERGRWVTAFIELASPYDVNNINVSTVSIEEVVPVSWGKVEKYKLMVKFDTSVVIDFIWTSKLLHMRIVPPQENKYIELTVTGRLADGTWFEGKDRIKVINP